MPRKMQDCGAINPQIDEIVQSALDARQFVTVTAGSADVGFAVNHGLGRVPTGYIPIMLDRAGVFYNSGTPWTSEKIFLKCNVGGVVARLMVF